MKFKVGWQYQTNTFHSHCFIYIGEYSAKHNLSNILYQIPFMKYHLSNNIYQIPFNKYH